MRVIGQKIRYCMLKDVKLFWSTNSDTENITKVVVWASLGKAEWKRWADIFRFGPHWGIKIWNFLFCLQYNSTRQLILFLIYSFSIKLSAARAPTGLFVWSVRSHAHASASIHANLSARAICRTHEKSYSAEKVLFHRIFFFQSFVFVYERHLWIMRYMSIAYRRRWLRRPERRRNGRSVLSDFFVSVFSFVFF